MAVMAGKNGSFKIGGTSSAQVMGYIDNFSLTVNQGSAETSQIGKAWKEFIAAALDWSGSVSGTLDYADAAQKSVIDGFLTPTDTPVTLEMKVGLDLTLTGTAIMTSASITGSHGDKVAISFNFQGTGTLAEKESA